MKRKIITFLSCMSFILCLSTAGVWIESLRRPLLLFYSTDPVPIGWQWHSTRGAFYMYHFQPPVSCDKLTGMISEHVQRFPSPTPTNPDQILYYGLVWDAKVYGRGSHDFFGLHSITNGMYFTGTTGSWFTHYVIRYEVLFWMTLIGSIPLFLHWYQKYRAKKLSRIGLCKVCGYDLRAAPERCPECGTMIIEPVSTN